jgi:hypothetical protein
MPTAPPPAAPRDDPYVAVEFDVLDTSGAAARLLLCNRGVVTRTLGGALYEYYPRLTGLPIQLGASITVTQYGSAIRSTPNAGTIQFLLDASIWPWTAYHWIGRAFRVYEGAAPPSPMPLADVDADLVLVYTGRVANFTHDTITATVQTTDASSDFNKPLVTDFYDATFPVSLQGKPKPYLWGAAFSIAPVIESETFQTWRVSARPGGLDAITAVRVGGVPWTQVTAPPGPGQWSADLAGGRFQLGSPPGGGDVRCDAQQGSYTLAGLITAIVSGVYGGQVDPVAMAALTTATSGQQASLATTTTPINGGDAIDLFVGPSGCWWGLDALGRATAGAIDAPPAIVVNPNPMAPPATASYSLDVTRIKSLTLDALQQLAWRIRVGSQKNWQPETVFDAAVLQTDQYKWAAPALVYEPHYENSNALALEPLAVDVPLLASTSPLPADAAAEQTRLIAAWGLNRDILTVSAWMRPEDIVLYDTVELDYMMATGNFRIISAVRSIGGAGPATLQLWGTLGAVPPLPPGNPAPPPVYAPPPTPTPIVMLIDPLVGLQVGSPGGMVLSPIYVTMSDGSVFTGTVSITLIAGPPLSSNYLVASTTVLPLVNGISVGNILGASLYSITQPVGPSYVALLTPTNLAWWLATSATVTPYTGSLPTPRPGASLYLILQPSGGPSYIGDLEPADVAWWVGAGADVTPYVPVGALLPGETAYVELSRLLTIDDIGTAQFAVTATQAGQSGSAEQIIVINQETPLYNITQPSGPSYVGNLTVTNVAWWQNAGATVTPYTGTLPTPRAGAALYAIIQPGSATNPDIPNYIGDLEPADVTWWENAGATVTLYTPAGALAPPFS